MSGRARAQVRWFFSVALVLAGIVPRATGAQTSDLRRGIRDYHQRHLPDGPGPHATLHGFSGCGGLALPDASQEAALDLSAPGRIVRGQYAKSAERLKQQGYAVLLVDVHRSEDRLIACGGEIPSGR